MSVGMFPRIESIIVPDDIRRDCIGKYVSSEVTRIFTELGSISYNPKSIVIKPLNERVFHVYFEATGPYVLPRTLDIREAKEEKVEPPRPDPTEQVQVEQDEMALRNKGGFGKVFKVGK